MALSSEIISQFVKSTAPKKAESKESVAYGTIVVSGNKKRVRLDGSDVDTPITQAVAVSENDRVVVQIKNHTAYVTGNLTAPSPSGTMEGFMPERVDNMFVGYLNANYADLALANIDEAVIGEAYIDYLNAYYLEAGKAKIELLETDKASIGEAIVGRLDTDYAHVTLANIDTANIGEAFVKYLDAGYANLDFANIGDAAIRRVFATTGMIENLMINQGKITGDLAAVRIDGDLITANTIHADRIVIKGEDGLYYELNTSGLSPEALKEIEDDLEDRDLDPTTELNNRLHGSNIIAQSITANKIFVDDLYAFGATIGGFDIEEHSLHSHSKSSLSSTAPGVFMDDSGQLNIGDNDDYIKYTKIENTSDYRLDISAAVVTLGTNKTNVEAEILSSSEQITNQADQIAELSNSTSQELNSVRDAIGVNEEAIDSVRTALNSAQGELDAMTGFIKVDSAAATMELGKNDSPFGVRITNEEIDFKIDREDGQTDFPAYIGISKEDSKSRFYVERASFEEEIAFGNFILVKHVVDGKTNVGIIRRGGN